MEDITTIVWDWNGTLLDDVELCMTSINRLLQEHHLPQLDHEHYQRVFQFPIIEYYRKAGFDFEQESFESLAHRYMRYYQPRSLNCSLYAHAQDVLRSFQEKGKRQVLLSASRLDYLRDQLSRYPIAPFFEEVLGIHDVYARSKASLAQRFIAHSGIDPQGVVFAGDSVHDYEVASAAGCRCVLIANGHEHKDKLKQCGCPVVDDISAFASLF